MPSARWGQPDYVASDRCSAVQLSWRSVFTKQQADVVVGVDGYEFIHGASVIMTAFDVQFAGLELQNGRVASTQAWA